MVVLPNGPSIALWNLAQWWVRPLEFLEDCRARYGDAFTVRLPALAPSIVTSDPRHIRDLFTVAPERIRITDLSQVLRPVLGDGSLMLMDGARHLRERKLLLPPFHGERLRGYAETMHEAARRLCRRMAQSGHANVSNEVYGATLEVMARLIFGEAHDRAAIMTAAVDFVSRATSPLLTSVLVAIPAERLQSVVYEPVRGPFAALLPWGGAVRAQWRLDELILAEIAEHRRLGEVARPDVLGLLASVRDEAGGGMSDAELRDEIVTLLLAGSETTASTVAWIVYHVLSAPAAAKELRRRLHALPEGSLEALAQEPFLDAAIKEAMRLDPVMPIVVRHVAQDMRIGELEVPAGTNVMGCVYLAQRDPDVWPDALRFVPERWLNQKTDPYAFFPFGGGTRRCIGAAFATLQMKMIVGAMFRDLDLRLLSDEPVRPFRKGVNFAPRGGVDVVVSG